MAKNYRERFSKELLLIVHQYLKENDMEETAHELEKESGYYFDKDYFYKKLIHGEWGDIENYLFGFTRPNDNPAAYQIFFEIRKQKYLEALFRENKAQAREILVNELSPFINSERHVELPSLLLLQNLRDHPLYVAFEDKLWRRNLVNIIDPLLSSIPSVADKTSYPHMPETRLQQLLNQSLEWQLSQCKERPRGRHVIRTIFEDHNCRRNP